MDEPCPICIELINKAETPWVTTPCGHEFHEACFRAWMGRSGSCPTCRTHLYDEPTDVRIDMPDTDDTVLLRMSRATVAMSAAALMLIVAVYPLVFTR
jgi:hypothetical protein